MVPLFQFFFVCASVVSYVAFALSLCASHLSFFWCLGKAVLRDCSIFWVSSLKRIFVEILGINNNAFQYLGYIKHCGLYHRRADALIRQRGFVE